MAKPRGRDERERFRERVHQLRLPVGQSRAEQRQADRDDQERFETLSQCDDKRLEHDSRFSIMRLNLRMLNQFTWPISDRSSR